MNNLKTHLAANWKLTEEELSTFLSAFDLITLQKGEAFSLPEALCNQTGLIQSRLMKCVLVENEKETIFEFAYENNFIADYYSFLTGYKS